MNIAYLLLILETDKLSELVSNIDGVPLDVNLAIWGAIDNGEIEINEEEDSVKLLANPAPSYDEDLAAKLLDVIKHYAKNEVNITRGRLNAYIKDPTTGQGYAWHDYIMSLQYLIDTGAIEQDVIDVPREVKRFTDKKGREKKKEIRPAHKFAFLQLPKNNPDNAEWNAKAVNKWIEDFKESK